MNDDIKKNNTVSSDQDQQHQPQASPQVVDRRKFLKTSAGAAAGAAVLGAFVLAGAGKVNAQDAGKPGKFSTPDWKTLKPGKKDYDKKIRANPFKTFAEIPAKARYQFMLDDARFFVMGFIKGPVCRGQIALNVVNDHFFVAFTNPEKDTISNDSAFLMEVSDFLRIPSEKDNNIEIITTWLKYSKLQQKYLAARNQHLAKSAPGGEGRGIDHIWNGGRVNDNALLTVFRHFDSASVHKGFIGKAPKTAWVVDYSLFERIHYLLVAGFDIFGNVGHQAETRIFMDYLRMEGESNFLSFLPKDRRQEIWDDWYEDARDEAEDYLTEQFYGLERGTAIAFLTDKPKAELFKKLMAHVGPATAQHDLLNRCADADCIDVNAGPLEQAADRQIRRLAEIKGKRLEPLPDISFLRVEMGGKEKDVAYTVIRNKALSNISYMFNEDHRRKAENDTLTVVKGYVGSYPNTFTIIPIDQIESAVDEYLTVNDAIDYYNMAKKYMIKRNSPDFWKEADWHYRNFLEQEPIEGGLFDMYRFHRVGEKSDAARTEW